MGVPEATVTGVVVNGVNVPVEVVDHVRSAAGLVARAGSDCVLIAVHVAVFALIARVHGAFDWIVAVGPVVAAKPAS